MKKNKLILVLVILCFYAQTKAQYKLNDEKEIVIGTVDSLYSDILKEQREVWIHLPENLDETEKYPVIYLLDTSHDFYVFTGMLKRLLPWRLPKSIVVGIRNTDRIRDFSPTNVPFHRARKSETSGGAGNFIKFIDQELKPFINEKYPTEDISTIVGHSFGGLFVLYSFLNNRASFDNYLAIDPSLWWDEEKLVKSAQKKIDENNYNNKSLYVAVANSIGKGLDTVAIRNDKAVITEQIRANLKFHDILVQHRKKLDFKWEYFDSEDHGSVVVPAHYNGLQYLFSWFPFPELWRLNTPNSYTVDEMIDPYYVHYKKLSQKMKREVKPDWALVNDIGLLMIEGPNSPEKALAFHQMNLDFYPEESRSYVALGDYYVSQKEQSIAKEYYKKAIEIDGNENAKIKLKQLKN